MDGIQLRSKKGQPRVASVPKHFVDKVLRRTTTAQMHSLKGVISDGSDTFETYYRALSTSSTQIRWSVIRSKTSRVLLPFRLIDSQHAALACGTEQLVSDAIKACRHCHHHQHV